ncbi:MAG: VCBS repeat-containing protein, partial [Nanoarchaeota archaeon]
KIKVREKSLFFKNNSIIKLPVFKKKKQIFRVSIILLVVTLLLFINATPDYLNESSQWLSNLTGVRFSSTALGDIDNDGDLDLASIGCLSAGSAACTAGTIAKIYINNMTSLVENSTWQNNLTGVGVGSLAFGDLDNDGDLDLSLIGCTSSSDVFTTRCEGDRISKIYLNNGTSLVENSIWQSNLTGVTDASSELADIDNDGDLDLIMNGISTTSRISKVYINNGTSLVENSIWQSSLTGVTEGQLALGDVDKDGKLDLLIVGDDGTGNFIKLYINNGTSLVIDSTWNTNLLSRFFASSIFGDYDNDGDLDLMVCGQLGGDHCTLYQNNGSTLGIDQTEVESGFTGVFKASIAFGDYDNDGDLDLVQMGNEAGRSKISENNGSSDNYNFVVDIFAPKIISSNLLLGSLAWGDLDNDNDLDLITISSESGVGIFGKVYLSNRTITKNNTKPAPPTINFASSYSDGVFNLNWGNGSDPETNTSGLYYNLMVGNTTKNNTIVSGVYGGSSGGAEGGGGGAKGYFGNMIQRKNMSFNIYL